MLSSFQQLVELDYQLVEFDGILLFDNPIAESSDFVFLLGRHSD